MPDIDRDSADYWEGLAHHELRLQRCAACGRLRFPPMPACPFCGGAEWSVETHAGSGTVYSYIVVHRPFDPAFADDVPYTVAVVELDDGPRIVGRLDRCDAPAIGLRVAATFVDHDDWTELRFAP